MGVLWEDNRGPVGDQGSGGGPVGVSSPSSTEKSHRGAPLAGARPGKAALRRRPPALTSGLASGAPRHEGSGAKLGGQREPRRAAEGAPNSAREGPGGASGSARPRREGGKEEEEEEEGAATSSAPSGASPAPHSAPRVAERGKLRRGARTLPLAGRLSLLSGGRSSE